MQRVATTLTLLLALLLACAPAQQVPATSPEEAPLATPEAGREAAPAGSAPTTDTQVYRFKHVTVDLEANTVSCQAVVIRAEYALEFLLCRVATKEHESLMVTSAEAWQIHAGLLMLGLTPGKPGTYVGQGEQARYIPPRGPALDIRLHWTDKTGKAHDDAATDWLKIAGQAADGRKPQDWIFVGSDIMPGGRYLADADGGIIAVANLPSAVIDVPFESAQPLAERLYELNTEALPPVGTKVDIVIRPREGGKTHPHARAWLEIDRNGQMTLDGEPIAMNELRRWAADWTRDHSEGQVIIRASALTPGVYTEMARLELKIGGVFEFEKRVSPLFVPLMPRTPAQVELDLAEWQQRFAAPEDELREPGERAEEALQQIRREREELKRLDALWAEYETQLGAELDAYRKAHPESMRDGESLQAMPEGPALP